ncbi:hypothetical protein ACQ3I4_00420 [Zafaria sp. Z1313]|uniref:hypothetical protein n=1 Tax=Zafaria sp. Z1313 TaxID=3423202 RepID=UPI003D303DDB
MSAPAWPARGGEPHGWNSRTSAATGTTRSSGRTARACTGSWPCSAGSAPADPADPRVAAAVDRVHAHVVWSEWGELPYFHGEVEPCINGGVVAQAASFGRLGAGSERLVDRLLGEQLEDGGWNCEAPGSSRSSFDSTLNVLEAFLEFERAVSTATHHVPAEVTAQVAAARRRGEEYLLERSLYRRLSTGEVAQGRYLNFSFPPYWFYDVLRALDYFRDSGRPFEARMGRALEELVSRRDDEGRWLAGVTWPGAVYFDVDAPQGEPSPWNTLRALRVLRWADAGPRPA